MKRKNFRLSVLFVPDLLATCIRRGTAMITTATRGALLLFVCSTPIPVNAQIPAVLEDSVTRAIDEQVWRPFVKAFNTTDAQAFIDVHAREAIRWPLGWGQPQPGDSIRAQALRNWSVPPPANEGRSIELYFTHRSHTKAFAFDIGYYRVMVAMSGGVAREFYGHFSTILGRQDGRWRIFLDADNGEGVTREDLEKAVPLSKD